MSIHPWDVEGGPAFPVVLKNDQIEFKGMSLRDWFAGQALPTLLDVCSIDTIDPGKSFVTHTAEHAYEIADAMLAARKTEAA